MKSKNENNIMPFIILILIIIAITFAVLAGYNRSLYKTAIKQGAKNTVTALEMVVACQQLSNVTSEQIEEQFIKTFINVENINIKGTNYYCKHPIYKDGYYYCDSDDIINKEVK